ncbi:hypothetical protein HBI21_077300 [Parastagonospora nodorum]|nr:hypothetical protein HBI21_077300 [Parastagonospora nodorum]
MAPATGSVAYLINNVVLPPDLPQGSDYSALHDEALLNISIQALQDLKSHVTQGKAGAVLDALNTMQNLRSNRDSQGYINEVTLSGILEKLVTSEEDFCIPLEIKMQNAALLVRRDGANVIFESFELSPTNEASMTCNGRLKRSFPGPASRISITKMREATFRQSLAATLANMSTNVAVMSQPDNRSDTLHPGLVTTLLTNVLSVVHEPADTVRIMKHTRDEALSNQAGQPWRRSPLWLLIRVTLHLVFGRMGNSTRHSAELYKAFVILLLSRILGLAKAESQFLEHHSLRVTSTKILRRIYKFGKTFSGDYMRPEWKNEVNENVLDVYSFLEANWKEATESTKANIDSATLSSLNPSKSLDLILPQLDAFLSQTNVQSSKTGRHDFNPTCTYPRYAVDQIPNTVKGAASNKMYQLIAIEEWVEKSLQGWVQNHCADSSSCGELRRLMQNYHDSASSVYSGIPASMSVMYLTLFHIWVQCDILACGQFPLLRKYGPEIQIDELQCLSLPFRSQMERLHHIESYVRSRRSSATKSHPSIFDNFGQSSSFAVKYYQSQEGSAQQIVLAETNRLAAVKHDEKCKELFHLKHQHRSLIDQIASCDCEFEATLNDDEEEVGFPKHSEACSRCALITQANGLSIEVFEYPLADEPCQAMATIFELMAPEAFSEWRDATYYMVTAILGGRNDKAKRPSYAHGLEKHNDLVDELPDRHKARRITIVSIRKSQTTDKDSIQVLKDISKLEEGNVCVLNRSKFKYFDKNDGVCIDANRKSNEELSQNCSYVLPKQSQALEPYMYRSASEPDGLPSNQVFAEQALCPSRLSVDEFKSFCTVPLGCELVYKNILLQLAVFGIDFAKTATQYMMQHIVHQSGPPNGQSERTLHRVLLDVSFCDTMLAQLEMALDHISENWESWKALATFSLLTRRILTLNSSENLTKRSLNYLASIRKVCLQWLHTLEQRASSSTDQKQRSELYLRTLDVASLGTSTFDVDENFFHLILLQPLAASALLQFSIRVTENQKPQKRGSQDFCKVMHHSWRRLMYKILPTLREVLRRNKDELNHAIHLSWSSFPMASEEGWAVLPEPQQHWLRTNFGTLTVHFDLLTGTLLVNGLPLTRLSEQFTQHKMYARLFGTTILEVGPSNEVGMQFSTKSKPHGYKIHFGMRDADMLLFAIGNNSKLEILPPRLLEGSLPRAFVSDYVHWYDRGKNEVILRGHAEPWQECDSEWRLRRTGNMWRLTRDEETCINITSGTVNTLLHIFRTLEDPNHVHITWHTSRKTIDIFLPRLQLDFCIKHGTNQIQSRQYRNMAIDTDQNIGILVGLANKLVLRGQSNSDRMVLIPLPSDFESESVDFTKTSTPQHVDVSIDTGSLSRVCAFTLDPTLRRVIDSGDLDSKLLLAYLHALTSHFLPDPFTRCTGTEAALDILRSASTRSFETLSVENVSILECIANLTPARNLHTSNTQQIHWDPRLPILSQDSSFFTIVKSIIDDAHRSAFLHPTSDLIEPKGLPVIDASLQIREAIRSSAHKVDGYGAEAFTVAEDAHYTSRETDTQSDGGQRTSEAATLILRDDAALSVHPPDLRSGLFSTHLKEVMVRSSSGPYDLPSLRFDTKWLGDSSGLLADNWCSLLLHLPKAQKKTNRFDIALWAGTMAYSSTADMTAIRTLAAFYRLEKLGTMKPPTAAGSFNLARGDDWITEEISGIAGLAQKSINECPESKLERDPDAKKGVEARRITRIFGKNQREAKDKFVAALRGQWPRCKPTTPNAKEIKIYLDVSTAMVKVRACFKAWHDNVRFFDYLDRISAFLAQQKVIAVGVLQCALTPPTMSGLTHQKDRHYAVNSVFDAPAPDLQFASSSDSLFVQQHETPSKSIPVQPKIHLVDTAPRQGKGLASLVSTLTDALRWLSRTKSERDYLYELQDSCTQLEQHEKEFRTQTAQLTIDTPKILHEHLEDCNSHLQALTTALALAVRGETGSEEEVAYLVDQAPRISPKTWLKCLSRENFESLSDSWKAVIIGYACAITHLHRAQRMVTLADKPLELAQELQNVGHTNWSPWEFPETLLLEVESGILVREVQEVVAAQMRNPPQNENTVCQLNMGDGKSSVIVPVVGAFKADGGILVRIIVAKPQSKQMVQVLISKLGGWLGRRVYFLPFTRGLRPSVNEAKAIRAICEECMENRGVILAFPEHVLSFKLMAIESLVLGRLEVASVLLDCQHFFDTHTFDMIDESDENFSPRFELEYTMGAQQLVEFAQLRVSIAQQVLGLLRKYAPKAKDIMPVMIEIHQISEEEMFPRVRTLHPNAARTLVDLIADHIVDYGLLGLPTRAFSSTLEKDALRIYISKDVLALDEIQAVERSRLWNDSTKHAILLVRGILAHGLLRVILSSKRWRVDYGLDVNRTPATLLAVPYRFKDGPNPRAEYSHPEVIVLLTCLSHYYRGLDDEQMFTALKHLSQNDQATVHFAEWVETASPALPDAFRTLSGINLRDRQHCIQDVFPHLHYSKACIDYFLSRLVFPKEFKQFPSSLSASGWDLGAVKTHPTTGFSGTKDAKHILPDSVGHVDLPSQGHTDALVLGHVLSSSSVKLLHHRTGGTDAEYILTAVMDCQPEVRVLLDCGAAILEQSNLQVAEVWLKMSNRAHVHAAIFFQDEDLSVLDRNGRVESLQTSPFLKQLGDCIVYLDEAHSRGTDLRLPRNYRACLTLGHGLTKDKLMQGCMRMRQLGKGQSITFLVPEEITSKIVDITNSRLGDEITVRDILLWSIKETWASLKKSIALWAFQGHRFVTREHISLNAHMTREQANEFLEHESQTIESRYSPGVQGNRLSARTKNWNSKSPRLAKIKKKCHDFGAMGDSSADFEEEQEREMAPEQEEEHELEHADMMEAANHTLHGDVEYLVSHGRIKEHSNQFMPAFQALGSTSAAHLFDLSQFPTDLLVTADFMRTVKHPEGLGKGPMISDSFQRMVQWVLSVPNRKQPDIIQYLVVMSPHEANKLRSRICRSTKVTLHLFAPWINSSYASLDRLALHNDGHAFEPNSVPRSLTVQLNLFAGSLYLRSYEEYTEICDFLGLSHSETLEGQQLCTDGFITPPSGNWGLTHSPVPLLQVLLMKIRREGEGLEKTHLGKILSGVRLEEADFVKDVEMSGT